jgi:hypothetical protein
MKECIKCHELKDLSEFYKRGIGTHNTCKACKRLHQQNLRDVMYNITKEQVLQDVSYSPETGCFTKNGLSCEGSHGDGYTAVYVNNTRYTSHRLAWFLMKDEWADCVDHIDGNKSNNAITNLRSCTQLENTLNQDAHRTGRMIGASFHKRVKKWQSYTHEPSGSTRFLGYYDTEREASLQSCREYWKSGLVRREFLPAEFTKQELGAI